MRHLLPTLSLLLLTGCNTVVDENYKSLQEAQQVGAFERRWLPDIVPASTHDITIRGDAELQVLAGELLVADEDFERLVAHLESYSDEPVGADQHLASFLNAKKVEGMESGVCKSDRSGLSAKSVFHRRGVSSATREAGCSPIR